MSGWRRWRFLAAQRSGRVRQTLVFAGMGLLIAALATAATQWQSQIRDTVRFVFAELATLGLAPVPLILGGILLVAALIIYLAPLPKTHSYLATNPQRIPRVAVYLDSENQLPNVAIEPFLAYVRSFVGGKRADLVFFTDAAHTADGAQYRALVKGGFRPVDVPHKRVEEVDGDTDNTKNAVDIELALYAYQQALLSPQPMEIVLVTGDRDYIPLIRRLWVEGHHVHVWALRIPTAMKELAQQLGVETAPFADLFQWERIGSPSRSAKPSKLKQPHGARATQEAPARAPASSAQDAPQPAGRGSKIERAQLAQAFASSVQLLEQARKKFEVDQSAIQLLSSRTGNYLKPITEALGFTGLGWTARWFLLLTALGVYARPDAVSMFTRGNTSPDEAAETLLRFLEEVSVSAYALAKLTPDDVVPLANLRDRLLQPTTQDPKTAALRALLEEDPRKEWLLRLKQVCHATASAGLMRYELVANDTAIRLTKV